MLDDLKEGAKRNPIWFGAVASITGVQAFFAWEFWGAVSADPAHQTALRVLGLGFVAGEVVALDMASRAALNDEHKRANALRALWAVLALTTFVADLNALSSVVREGDDRRSAAAAIFDANQAKITDLEQAIARADDPFGHELMSVAAYDAAIDGKARELRTAQRANARTWRILQLEREMTALTTERAAAVEKAKLETDLATARARPESHAPRPATGAVEFAPMAAMLTQSAQATQKLFGHAPTASVSPESVRGGMAGVAAFAMKLMLTFGIWVGLQRGRGTGAPMQRPATPDAPRTQTPVGAAAPAPAPPSRRLPGRSGVVFTRRGNRFGR